MLLYGQIYHRRGGGGDGEADTEKAAKRGRGRSRRGRPRGSRAGADGVGCGMAEKESDLCYLQQHKVVAVADLEGETLVLGEWGEDRQQLQFLMVCFFVPRPFLLF